MARRLIEKFEILAEKKVHMPGGGVTFSYLFARPINLSLRKRMAALL